MNKKIIGAVAALAVAALGVSYASGMFDSDEVTVTVNGKTQVVKKQPGDKVVMTPDGVQVIKGAEKKKSGFSLPSLFGPKANVTKNAASSVELQNYDNGMFSMKIPKGWTVGPGNTDYIHYTFMAYDPKNPAYKIFFNMKTEGNLKTQEMKNMYAKYYPNTPMAQLPVINPQTTEAFYKVFTQSYSQSQNLLPFKLPVIKNFKSVQTLGKNVTGGSIVRATYQDEQGKNAEGIFTATIKEFSMPPVVALMIYNTIFFTAPAGELVDWEPVLNQCVGSIRFSESFIDGYYKQENQTVRNANAIQAICNQTSDIITSGWNARQKTYDIQSQKRSDATMGYERVRNTETGEIYKATNGFSDHDWGGKYEKITDDMYTLPTAGYIEVKQ